jgi:DNA polymerase III subunit delta'
VLAQPHAGAGLLGRRRRRPTLALGSDNPVFRRVASGGHADLMLLEPGMINPETNKETAEIIVHHVRRAIEFLSKTPAEGGWRIVIVDHAEEMNRSAENALLKILEEPHARSLLLLVSHAPGRLLPTTRSRCRRLDMPALPTEILANLLARQAPELEATQRAALAVLAGGSIGRALELVASEGLDLYDAILVTVGARSGAGEAVHALADRVGTFGTSGQAIFRSFCELAQHLATACARHAAGAPVVAALAREGEVVHAIAGRDAGRWLAAWDRLRGLAAAADGINLDRRQTALAALTTLREAAYGRGG